MAITGVLLKYNARFNESASPGNSMRAKVISFNSIEPDRVDATTGNHRIQDQHGFLL